jgi:hypothetical protein
VTRINLPVIQQGVSGILAEKLGDKYIGASTARIRGWSSISNYMKCDRMFYYKSIKKYRVQRSSEALDVGIVLHECLAAHYDSGGVRTFEPLAAIELERPDIATEVKRLLYAYFAAYQQEDIDTFDVRAVEREIIGEVEYKGTTAPVYARLDLLVRKKTKDQTVLPAGPCPDGVWIIDHKTSSRMSQDLLEGYKMDGQFLLMSYLWHQQNFDQIYGPLKGFVMNIITKTKNPELKRLQIDIGDDDRERFQRMVAPTIVEMHTRMQDDAEKANEDNWPMNFAMCKNPSGYGPCEYMTLCLSHGKMAHYYETPKT